MATAETLTSLRVGTRVKPTGQLRFNASVDVLNKIQNAVRYTQMSNIHSHPEDCPQRCGATRSPALVSRSLPFKRSSCLVHLKVAWVWPVRFGQGEAWLDGGLAGGLGPRIAQLRHGRILCVTSLDLVRLD
eukprot:COSAG04_NODE_287_length_17998_cov_7.320018_10_plen_131_part_00